MGLNQHHHHSSILEALAYFDVFDFPLSKQEILKYSHFPGLADLEWPLNELLENEIIYSVGQYYSIRNDSKLASQREENALRAIEYLDQAKKKSKLISRFPYVKGVFISGSLSKGVMGEDGDIDFFIVTQPKRLWVARTLLILYKKIFLLNSRKYFCINYLVDENSLEIEQKNRFTAVELLSLCPMINEDIHKEITKKNSWIDSYFSGNFHKNTDVQQLGKGKVKAFLEELLNGSFGDVLDDFFMKITLKKWMHKFRDLSKEDFEIALKTSKSVSKHHPSNFQKKVLSGYEQRMGVLRAKLEKLTSIHPNRA